MDDENANTLCNHTYESFTLVAKKLFNVYSIFNNCNLVAHYNHNVSLKKIKHS
jgi:hypothetical protein